MKTEDQDARADKAALKLYLMLPAGLKEGYGTRRGYVPKGFGSDAHLQRAVILIVPKGVIPEPFGWEVPLRDVKKFIPFHVPYYVDGFEVSVLNLNKTYYDDYGLDSPKPLHLVAPPISKSPQTSLEGERF